MNICFCSIYIAKFVAAGAQLNLGGPKMEFCRISETFKISTRFQNHGSCLAALVQELA
jgi:hypothetical protein